MLPKGATLPTAPGTGKVGLKAVAAAAGVAPATVSRILNNRFRNFSVRPEVRARVLAAARALGYRPNLIARSLRGTPMGIFGLVGLEPPFDFPHPMIEGVLDVLAPRGIQLSAHFMSLPCRRLQPPAWRVDGLLVVATHTRDSVRDVDASGIPYVSINAWCGPRGYAVLMNDAQGTRLAMEHLLALGHRRIAWTSTGGPWRNHPSVRERRDAYRETLRAAGLPVLDGLPLPTAEDATAFLRAARQRGATAVLAYNHYIGLTVLKAAHAAGLKVPEDLSLVCFNDEYVLNLVHPPLTRVALPVREAGRVAAERLLALVEGRAPPERICRLDESLQIRESSGPAPCRR